MSWISENYEKASLGGAAVITVALGFFGWQNLGSVEEDFGSQAVGIGSDDPTVKGSDKVSTASSKFTIKREWVQGDDDGRPVDIFTGVPLFVNKKDLGNPVDLPESEPVHPPIPNNWWIENRIDPGFGDSPQRDSDGDGFSNLDEFLAETDPGDVRKYPSLATKIAYEGDESVQWVLRPGFPTADGAFTFEYSDTAGRRNKAGATSPVPPGESFFIEDPMKGRFKLLGAEDRNVMNEQIGAEVKVTFVKIEDQKPNKRGMKYEIPSQFRRSDAGKFSNYDRTAVITLEALGISGQEIKVEEFTTFALPPTAAEKRFRMLEVTPEFIMIEEKLEDGQTKSHKILKGAIGPDAE
ncbi:MAG: Amuc_1099 family pilus-like system protein [Akkermansiaceae bacterium]